MSALVDVSIVPASEVLANIIEEINATVRAAKDVLIKQQSFKEVSSFLERIVPVLKELTRKNAQDSGSIKKTIEILQREIQNAKQLTLECCKRKRVYLLFNCKRIVKRLQDATKEISRALSLIPLASLDLSSRINDEIAELCETMLKAEFRVAVSEEKVIEKIECGIQERNADRSYANKLLVLIAEAVGASTEQPELKKIISEIKSEIEDAQLRKDQAEAIQMDQIIALLGSADAAQSPKERESKYYSKRNSLGNQPLEPLQSFCCPITRDVMVDPVEISSGQTFERGAIEKWLADGHTFCPSTREPLTSKTLRSNITLRKSIEEWKERNTMIRIANMRLKLCSDDEGEILQCLAQLQELCEEKDLHREWVVLENYIQLLVELLGRNNAQLRQDALAILLILAKESDDNKEKIAEVDGSVNLIVRSLSRRIAEGKLAVALLLELSKHETVRNHIGQVQGCIFLIVTLSNSEDTQAATCVRDLLENLSFLDQNVVQMAKANYFKPLVDRLSSGSYNTKKIMAAALAEMELTDLSKSILFDEGAWRALLHLISDGDVAAKQIAVKALHNLSTLPRNGLGMIREGAVRSLLPLLYVHNASSPTLRELVAATIMNIAISASLPEAGDMPVPVLEYDDVIRLFALIPMTVLGVQRGILRTFHALCTHPSATEMRARLRECSPHPTLIQLCEHVDPVIRANAVKLFYCLTKDGDDGTLQEHVGQTSLELLLRIAETSDDEEEKAAVMGIISVLPRDHCETTQYILDVGTLQILVKFLTCALQNGSSKSQLTENAVGALCHFTVPTNLEWQRRAAEAGMIPLLVQLLASGSPLTKHHAAVALAQFSSNSARLCGRVEKRRGFLCFSAPSEVVCPVHLGVCSVESSFCLVEADAVEPLVRLLSDQDVRACNAALLALSTIIEGERLQAGSKVISEKGGISAIIRLLSSSSIELQEKALHELERVFRLEEYKKKYGASVHLPLVDITQRGTRSMKPLAARILAHLNVIHEQSSYF